MGDLPFKMHWQTDRKPEGDMWCWDRIWRYLEGKNHLWHVQKQEPFQRPMPLFLFIMYKQKKLFYEIRLNKAELSNTLDMVQKKPPVDTFLYFDISLCLCLLNVVFVIYQCCSWFFAMCIVIPFPVLMSHIYFLFLLIPIVTFDVNSYQRPLTWTVNSDRWCEKSLMR